MRVGPSRAADCCRCRAASLRLAARFFCRSLVTWGGSLCCPLIPGLGGRWSRHVRYPLVCGALTSAVWLRVVSLPVACCLLNESGGLYPDCLAVVLSCGLRCEAMLIMVGLREGFGGC